MAESSSRRTNFSAWLNGNEGDITFIGISGGRDLAGNLMPPDTIPVGLTVDTKNPTATINQAVSQADPAIGAPVVFDVVFSEPVTGFDASDVSFAGSTVGGTLVANVSGSGATYTVAVTGMTGNGTIVASIPAGVAADVAGNPSASSTTTDSSVTFSQPDVRVTNTAGAITAGPGDTVTFTVTVSNLGSLPVSGVAVSGTFPAGLTGVTFTSVASAGVTGNTTAGANTLADTVTIPVGGVITYTVTGTVAADFAGTLTTTATVTPAGGLGDDTNPADNSADASVAVIPGSADLAVMIDDGATAVDPGSPRTYTVTLTNNGPDFTPSASLLLTVPAGLTGLNFLPSVGSYDAATGLWTGLDLDTGESATLTVGGTIAAGAVGDLAVTATVFPPAALIDADFSDNVAADTNTITPPANGDLFAVGSEPGITATVQVFNAAGTQRFTLFPFANFTGGVAVATGDMTGDGIDDIAAATGPGAGPHVKVFDGRDLSLLQSFFAGDPSDTGGVFVGVANLSGDTRAEVVAGLGGRVKVFGAAAALLPYIEQDNLASFDSGVRTSVAAVRLEDGIVAVLQGAAPGNRAPSHVKAIDPTSGTVRHSFFAFDPLFTGGVFVG